MKKLFVTGGCGYVGSLMIQNFLDRYIVKNIEELPEVIDKAFEIAEAVAWVEYQLATGGLAHQQLFFTVEAHHRWGGTQAFGIGNNNRAPPLQNRQH